MKRSKRNKLLPLILLLVLGMTIGFAYLRTSLSINGSANLKGNTWNIYFDNVQVKNGSVTPVTAPTIPANDKTTLSFEVDLNLPGDFYEFTVDVVNAGTIDAMIDTFEILPELTDAQKKYIEYDARYSNGSRLKVHDLLAAQSSETLSVKLKYKDDLNPEDLPNNLDNITPTVEIEYIQATDEASRVYPPPTLMATGINDTTKFRANEYKQKIKTITFERGINVPNDAVDAFDIGVNKNGDVMSYIVPNSDDATMYDLHIQSDDDLYANKDMRYWFYDMKGVEKIEGLDLINTSKTTDFFCLFYSNSDDNMYVALKNPLKIRLIDGIENWDTSNVINMSYMFHGLGEIEYLNIENFDTRNVTKMRYMFAYNSNLKELKLGEKFDTSKVTDMEGMFYGAGRDDENFTLDLGNKFDTKNVKDFANLFNYTGYSSKVFELNLGDKFDTSNAESMSGMFRSTGYSNLNFTLDLGNKFDTSKVTNMYNIFAYTGYSSKVFKLDLKDKFDTSNVTTMQSMFNGAGNNSPIFTLNLGNKFDTSKVINMNSMFYNSGKSNSDFTLDLGNKFDTRNVTAMQYMFSSTGASSLVFTLDLGNKFDTTNVTNMRYMFWNTGYNSPIFTLNLGSQFDTSNVTDMSYMFEKIAYNNTQFALDCSGWNVNKVTIHTNFNQGAESKVTPPIWVN